MDITTIIGYVLFGLSEIIALLPINSNGFFDTVRVGLRNSITDNSKPPDVAMAQTLLHSKPEVAKIINDITTNQKLMSTVQRLTSNLHIVQFVNTLIKNPQLQYILGLLKSHPEVINEAKLLIETHLLKKQAEAATSVPILPPQSVAIEIPTQEPIEPLEEQIYSDDEINLEEMGKNISSMLHIKKK
jgi:hypothetical protein